MAKARSQPTSGKYPQQLRIIGGQWRGRRINVIASEGLRPTPDRIRETVFNWLQMWIPGASCLDLFAGSGALCLEALSRGATRAVMVEKSHEAATMIRQNIELLEATNAVVVNEDSQRYLLSKADAFDIVFVDPPFKNHELIGASFAALNQQGWIKPGGWVYIESSSALAVPELPRGWVLEHSKTAGQVGYHLARVNQNN